MPPSEVGWGEPGADVFLQVRWNEWIWSVDLAYSWKSTPGSKFKIKNLVFFARRRLRSQQLLGKKTKRPEITFSQIYTGVPFSCAEILELGSLILQGPARGLRG